MSFLGKSSVLKMVQGAHCLFYGAVRGSALYSDVLVVEAVANPNPFVAEILYRLSIWGWLGEEAFDRKQAVEMESGHNGFIALGRVLQGLCPV